MVTTVNSDTSITPGVDTASKSNRGIKLEATNSEDAASASQVALEREAQPDVEHARELYQLETSQPQSRPEINTAQQATDLLDKVTNDIARSPEEALKIQASGSTGLLTHLLTAAPA